MRLDVPYLKQRLEFSCGPACLVMAMKAHDDAIDDSPAHEIDVWREATIAAVPATSAAGLALAAHRRGFRARVVSSTPGLAFQKRIEAIMQEFYQDALTLLHDELLARAKACGVAYEVRPVTEQDVEHAIASGEVPVVLSDTAVLGDPWDPIPHWIVVSGMDAENVYVHTPLEEHEGARPFETYPRERFRDAIGFLGDSQMVAVGPRFPALGSERLRPR